MSYITMINFIRLLEIISEMEGVINNLKIIFERNILSLISTHANLNIINIILHNYALKTKII